MGAKMMEGLSNYGVMASPLIWLAGSNFWSAQAILWNNFEQTLAVKHVNCQMFEQKFSEIFKLKSSFSFNQNIILSENSFNFYKNPCVHRV